jgi:hypothetical protein
VPLIQFPTTITYLGVVYTQGTAYHVVRDVTPRRGSQQEVSGIEWETGIANGAVLTLNYTYNQVPELLDAVTIGSKQICTDVLWHVADYKYITTNLTVEYARNYAISTVNTAIQSRLQIFYQGLGFGAPIVLSQLIAAVQQVLGVNEVHVTLASEVPSGDYHYGIWVMDDSTSVASSTKVPFTADFVLAANQLAVFQDINPRQAPNIGGGGA